MIALRHVMHGRARWTLAALFLGACSDADAPPLRDAAVPQDAGTPPPLQSDASVIDGGASDGALAPPTDAGARADAAPDDAAAADAAPPIDLAQFDWGPGDYPPALEAQTYLELKDLPGQMGKTRGYKLHVPPGYRADEPAPILFALHGFQQNAVMLGVDGSGLIMKSDDEGFVLVMPNGIQEDGFGGSWNAGVCCGAASSQRLDDVGLMRAIYAEVSKHVRIDAGRVYATGLSNGGFMTYRLACEASDLFVAVAPVAGSIGTPELGAIGTNPDPDFKSCAPTRPVAVLAVHGNGDGIVPYSGMKPSLDLFAKHDGCSATTTPAALPASGGDTTCVTYGGCADGLEVTGCTVANGGHCWFGDESCGTGAPGIGNLAVGNNSNFLKTTDAVWDFVRRFRR